MKTPTRSWIIAAFIALFFSNGSDSQTINSLMIPTIADPRENVVLGCRYDMEKDHLFSTKWYKNDQEIFRYMPTQNPPGLHFPVDGVKLAKPPRCSQTSCDLELTELTLSSTGLYKCEVSTEAPTFRIKHRSGNMTVAAILRRDPLVEGASTSYALGDEIRVNCTSDPSMPPAEVTWYINDNEATFPYLEGAVDGVPDAKGLATRSLGLRLRADRLLFMPSRGGVSNNGYTSNGGNNMSLMLRCVSAMPKWIPGGPHKRQFAITATLRQPFISNQKLELMGSNAVTTSAAPLLMALTTFLRFLRSTPVY